MSLACGYYAVSFEGKTLILILHLNNHPMARQAGDIKISGTLDNLTFYKDGDHWLVRKKTSLDKKRVMKDPAFERSRKAMVEFGTVSKFCSQVYHQLLPKKKKGKGIQQKMTGRARTLFLEGNEEEKVVEILLKEFGK